MFVMSERAFIFDLDGTLYRYKGGSTFATSEFYGDLKKNIFAFLEQEIGIPSEKAVEVYAHLKQTYGGHVSIGVEREYGVEQARYFASTWNMDPERYIEATSDPRGVLEQLHGRKAVLTEAPRVWAERALAFLKVDDLFGDLIFTGDASVRKPSPEAFKAVGNALAVSFRSIYSVGDQEESDVLAPQSIGMRAIRIGVGETAAEKQIASLKELPGIFLQDTLIS